MVNSNDLLARLANGESADALAKEFTDALNAAQKEYETKSKDEEKLADFSVAVDAMLTYLKKWHPDLADWDQVIADEGELKDMLEGIESLIELAVSMRELSRMMPETSLKPNVSPKLNADTVLASWLKNLN